VPSLPLQQGGLIDCAAVVLSGLHIRWWLAVGAAHPAYGLLRKHLQQ
jgi:hypothetical protein